MISLILAAIASISIRSWSVHCAWRGLAVAAVIYLRPHPAQLTGPDRHAAYLGRRTPPVITPTQWSFSGSVASDRAVIGMVRSPLPGTDCIARHACRRGKCLALRLGQRSDGRSGDVRQHARLRLAGAGPSGRLTNKLTDRLDSRAVWGVCGLTSDGWREPPGWRCCCSALDSG